MKARGFWVSALGTIATAAGAQACVTSTATATAPRPRDAARQDTKRPVLLEKIAPGVWVHKSYKFVEPWGLILSHGLIVRDGDSVTLVDTAWTPEDTTALVGLIRDTVGRRPDRAVVTHAHDDKMGGVSALTALGIPAFATRLTNEDARVRGLEAAPHVLESGSSAGALTFGAAESAVDIFHPGAGHTRDNIVVYHGPSRVLFGGCLIRPGGSKSLGNTADADVGHWADAVRAVKARYPEAARVVPSHGPVAGPELLDHTIRLAEAGPR